MGCDARGAPRLEDLCWSESLTLLSFQFCVDSAAQGHLAWRIPICQRCAKLRHACSGLADRVCGRCMHDHKVCQEVVVEGECLYFFLTCDSEVTPRTSHHSTFSCSPSRPPS